MRIARTIATLAGFAAAAAIAAAPAYATPAPIPPVPPAAAPVVAANAVPAANIIPAANALPAATPALAAAASALGGGDTSAMLAQLAQIPGLQQIATTGQLPTTDIPTLLRMLSSAQSTGQLPQTVSNAATVPTEPLKFPVHGAIGDAFTKDGGQARYGQPLGLEKPLAGGWKVQDFTNGAIYWNPKVNNGTAAGVGGDISKTWLKAGGANGKLGYPLMSETQIAGPTAGTVAGAYNDFEHGSIYWSPQFGAHVVDGKIRDQFIQQGGANTLGYPTTDVYPVPGGIAQTFTKGTVTIKD